MKKILMIIGAVILAAAIAGGSFYGGIAYQRSQAASIRNTFLRSRGLEGTTPGQGGFPGAPPDGANIQGGGFFGRGVTGEVKSVDGNTLTLSTVQNETTVTLTANTVVEKTLAGALADLQPGQRVTVTGERDDKGNLTALQVLILSDQSSQATSGSKP